MVLKSLLCSLVTLTTVINVVDAFNVDVGSRVVHGGPRDTCDNDCMFGFSVAQHREQGTPWLLVGAPTADSRQPGVTKGGAVYKCNPDAPGSCDLIPFDTNGNTLAPTGQQYDKKSGQWFGSLVQSSGDNGVILACAPRYVWFSRNYARREPIGTCYTARNNFADFFEYSPCRTRKWGYHRQGSCQAGLGAAIADNGEQMFVGAPGSWYWQGQVYSLNISDTNQFHRRSGLPGRGQVFSQNLAALAEQHKTGEGSPDDDDSYLGYSVTTGEFDGDSDQSDVAVGMPRGAGLTGKILIYDSKLTNLYNLTGDQIGAYFGYSIAAGDLNGDGLDDLIIGAPMWTNYEVMGKYETGRVYIVYQDRSHKFKKFDTLDGQAHRGRFGQSVACAGNLNLDGRSESNPKGIEDLVVGAPYESDGGAIYIYMGSTEGILGKPAQVIRASDVGSNIRTFGWSLSAGMDLDRNEYPDLLIGAYESANAVYLKSAPVVHLKSKINFLKESKQINLDSRRCKLRDGRTQVPCVKVEVEMEYDGVGVPDQIALDLQYVLDAKKDRNKRMFFLNREGEHTSNRTATIDRNRKFRDTFDVYLPGGSISDKLTTLDAQVRYQLKENGFGGGRSRRELKPVLGQFEKMASDSISIQKDCGPDNLCIPNLSIEPSTKGAYVIGSGERLEITTEITNSGEDAFNAYYFLQIPRGINYIRTNSTGNKALCSSPTPSNNNTLKCEIGNPLPANSNIELTVYMKPTEDNQELFLEEYRFLMAVNSSNPEDGSDNQDNQRLIRVPVSVSTDWRVTGTSKPAQVEYNISQEIPDKYYFEDELGEEIFHVYDVKNRGPSTIQEAEVFILWPSKNENGDHLLYLLGVEYNNQKVQCDPIDNINPLYVKTINSRGYAAAQSGVRTQTGFAQGSQSGRYSGGSSTSSSSSSGSIGSGSGESTYSREYSANRGAAYGSNNGGKYGTGGRQGGSGYSYSESSSSSSSSSYGAGSSGGLGYGEQGGGRVTIEQGSVVGTSATDSGSDEGSSYQGTRWGSTTTYHGGSGGSSEVAVGAEETRLSESSGSYGSGTSYSASNTGSMTGGQGSLGGSSSSGSRSSYDYERNYGTTYGSSSSAGSSQQGGNQGGNQGGSFGIYGSGSSYNQGQGSSVSSNQGSSVSYNRGSSSSSSNSYDEEPSRGTIQASGWKLLPNGTYIRVYDAPNTAGNSGSSSTTFVSGSYGGSSGSSRNEVNTGSIAGNGQDQGSNDSGWVRQPDGSFKRRQSQWSSWSSSSGYGGGNARGESTGGNTGGSTGSSSGGSFGLGQGNYGSQGGSSSSYGSSSESGSEPHFGGNLEPPRGSSSGSYGSSYGSSATETRLGGGSGTNDANTNTIINAARGPDNYHGTISQSELDREAGGSLLTSTNEETRHQVDNTRYQGNVNYGSSFNSGSNQQGGGSYGGSNQQGGGSYGSSNQQGGSFNSGSEQQGGSYGSSSTFNSESSSSQSGSSGSSSSSNTGSTSSSGSQSSGGASHEGKWVWSEENNKWEWEEAGIKVSHSGSQGSVNVNTGANYNSGYEGGVASGNVGGGQLKIVDESYAESKSREGGTSYQGASGRFGGRANEGNFQGFGGNIDINSNRQGGGSYGNQGQQGGSSSSQHGGSSYSYETENRGGSYGGSQGGYRQQGGQGGYRQQGGRYGQGGQSGNRYFESGRIGESNTVDGGYADAGWIKLANGSYMRKESSWSKESSYGGVTLTKEEVDELMRQNAIKGSSSFSSSGQEQYHGEGEGHHIVGGGVRGSGEAGLEDGDKGTNSTGWIRQPDGTMIKKTSSWASWSKTSYGEDGMDPDELKEIQRRLEMQAKGQLNRVRGGRAPGNVEPGFEQTYRHLADANTRERSRQRVKREYSDSAFQDEINDCVPGRCTLMRCTIGPLLKEESVLFRIRSRLVTETQIKNYADKVQISSKLVTRIVRLPYQSPTERVSYETHQVTTEVFPSELAEGSIPWWVWLLAALFGLLLLALIIFCLWKCGFFKRKRPTDSPEKQPLNRNGSY